MFRVWFRADSGSICGDLKLVHEVFMLPGLLRLRVL